MKRILVTGGAGFIGSNFVHYMLGECDGLELLVNLDLLTYAGNLENLAAVQNDRRYVFVHGDIRDRVLVNELFDKYDFDTVVHFAAESHVDRSILEPELFLTTNVVGTQCLLDAAKRHWNLEPDNKYCQEYREGVVYLWYPLMRSMVHWARQVCSPKLRPSPPTAPTLPPKPVPTWWCVPITKPTACP